MTRIGPLSARYPAVAALGVALAAALIAAGALAAQETPALSIHVDVRLVNIAFVVRDAAGVLKRDLTKDDIEVFEDGVKQEVKFFSRASDLPLRLALVVDASESQGKFMKQHRRDIEAFVKDSIAPQDRALLVCFGDRIRVVSDFTPSAADLLEALNVYQRSSGKQFAELEPDRTRDGGTAFFDAVYLTAVHKLSPAAGERQAMILFSDGEDNSSAHDLMDAIEAAQSGDIRIYTVRYTAPHHGHLTARNRYGIREMDRLANETGAIAFDAATSEVGAALRQVTEELRGMYEVGYVPTNPTQGQSFRKVTIRAKPDGLTVRAKPGYYAQSPK